MKVTTLLTERFETVEALAVIDILRRAKITVDIVSITGNLKVKSAQNIFVDAEFLIENYDFNETDLLFLPGGPGTSGYEKSRITVETILRFAEEEKKIAAICAAPSILGHLELLDGKKATCFPGYEDELKGAEAVCEKVITDGNITTSRGMGTSLELGLELVKILADEKTSIEIGKAIQYL